MKPVDDLEIQGHIVRIHANGSMSYGVQFGAVDPSAEKKLRRLASS